MKILQNICLWTILLMGGNQICFATSKNETPCHKLLRELAHTQMHYVSCSTNHAVPVKMCIGCEPKYTEMILAYESLQQNCSNEYFNHDRINVVETTQKMMQSLWNKAFCDDCFSSNNSQTFDSKSADLQTCLNTHKGSECKKCFKEYDSLNKFYIQINDDNNGKVCFDLQDAMNITRVLWSKTLNCCPRELRITGFVVAVSCFGALPVLFYIGAIVLTKRREQNNLNLPINETNTTTTNNLPTQSATPSTASVENVTDNRYKKALVDDSENDDDILPVMKTVT